MKSSAHDDLASQTTMSYLVCVALATSSLIKQVSA